MHDTEHAKTGHATPEAGKTPVDVDALLDAAREVAYRAHAPYSGFRVGAAVLDATGVVHVGCNVESGTYTLTSHAEANAIAAAIAAGAAQLVAVAVVCLDASGQADDMPCGLCRQVIHEMSKGQCVVAVPGKTTTIAALLPDAFLLVPTS